MNALGNISIAICTYNRCDQLRLTLATLEQQASSLIEGDQILVINNNCTDATSKVISEFSDSLPVQEHFASEQGLSAARNVALQQFGNSHLLFVDDDINIGSETLRVYRNAIAQFPEDDFFGGKIHVDWASTKPSWLRNEAMPLISGLIGHYDPAQDEMPYTDKSLLPYGANFLVSRRLTAKVGEFDTKLGVKGEDIARGEETDYLLRALNQRFNGRFLSNADVGHRFQSERLSSSYLYSYGRAKGGAGSSASPVSRFLRSSNYLMRGVWQLLRGRRDRYYQSVINAGIAIGRDVQ